MDQYLVIGDVILFCHDGEGYAINDAIDKKQRVLKSVSLIDRRDEIGTRNQDRNILEESQLWINPTLKPDGRGLHSCLFGQSARRWKLISILSDSIPHFQKRHCGFERTYFNGTLSTLGRCPGGQIHRLRTRSSFQKSCVNKPRSRLFSHTLNDG
jgi:hypothetical protein